MNVHVYYLLEIIFENRGEKIRLNAVFGKLINLSVSISTDSVLCSDDSKKTPRSNHEDRRFQDFVN